MFKDAPLVDWGIFNFHLGSILTMVPLEKKVWLLSSPFAWTKHFLSRKIFYPRLKGSYLHGKRMENDFLAMDKIFSSAKKSFFHLRRQQLPRKFRCFWNFSRQFFTSRGEKNLGQKVKEEYRLEMSN